MLAMGKTTATCGIANIITNTQCKPSQLTTPFANGQGIVIVGGSGAGKTTLGTQLASIIGLPFVDSDSLVELKSNDIIANIFAYHNEVGFRFLEAQAIRSCITTPSVIALGAGGWEDPTTRETVIKSGFATLWLAESPETAWIRVVGDKSRPLVTTYDQFLDRWTKRMPAWDSAIKIIPSKLSPNSLAKRLVKTIEHS